MTKKVITSIISVVCALCLIGGVFAGCNAKSKDKEDGGKAAAEVSGSITVISREDGSGTRGAFTELVKVEDADKNDATVETAEITNSTSVMMSTVAGNKKAIGYISLGSLSEEVKALSVDGVAPSVETVKDGSYKLQRPFNIAYKDGELSDLAKDFISFIMSKQGQAIVEKEGYISQGADAEYTASSLSGTISLAGSTSISPLMNVLADEYKALNPNVKIEIQESGSSAGVESAVSGAADIAMVSRELKEEELAQLKPVVIALDGIAVIVNNENAIDNITMEQLRAIYMGEVSAWENVK